MCCFFFFISFYKQIVKHNFLKYMLLPHDLQYYYIQGYFRPVLFSPFPTCKKFRPVLNSPNLRVVFKQREFDTLEFTEFKILPLTTRVKKFKKKTTEYRIILVLTFSESTQKRLHQKRFFIFSSLLTEISSLLCYWYISKQHMKSEY